MGSRKKRRLRELAARQADPYRPPEAPLAADPIADARAALAAGQGARARETHFEEKARNERWRRRLRKLWMMAAVALLTFLTVAWLIYRAEQRRLEVDVRSVP